MDVLRRNFRELDFSLFGVLILLAAFSCVALLTATYGKPLSSGVPPHILMKQIIFEVMGLVALLMVAVFDYRTLRKYRWWLYGISIALLLVVYAMPSRKGSFSWIPLGLFSFQPSELAKLTMIVGIAGFMAHVDEEEFPDYGWKKIAVVGALFVVPFALTLKEPALGQALVMFAIVLTMLAVFAKRSHFVLLTAGMIAFVAAMVLVASQFPVQTIQFIDKVLVPHHLIQSFQAYRIHSWLDPTFSLNRYGYNVHQAEIAIGSGQIFGEGIFGGIKTKGGWIPNQWNDYIFTTVGEELGFVGSSVLILLFLMLIYRLIRIAGTAQDTFGTYVITGIIGMFAFQIFENIGADMYLSPSTGITLPFISYGGSSLIINYIAVGLVVSVALRRKKLRFA